MYLRDLAVYASDEARLPPGRSPRDFNVSAQTPVEAYLDRLPRRRVVLGDLAKVNVVVGPRPAGEPAYFAALNVAIVFWPRFDFGRYFALSRAGQQRRIIGVLHKALVRLAGRTNSCTTWYDDALVAFRDVPLPLPELTEFELRRRWGLLLPHEKKALKRRGERPARPGAAPDRGGRGR